MVQTLEKTDKKAVNTLKTSIYAIYDTMLKQFEPPFACVDSQLDTYMSLLINDTQSRYYGKEDCYILNKIANFNLDTGYIDQCTVVERIQFLDKYIDKNKRKLQTIISTLNYLPSGYFKMPEEQKKSIQDRIDECIIDYVANYVIPDLDTSKLDVHNEEIKDVINKSLSS